MSVDFDYDGAVVRVYDLLENSGSVDALAQGFGYPMVVDAPTGIACSCSETHAPPRVLVGFLTEESERVDESRSFPLVHPFAFFWEETAHAFLSFGMVDVDGFMADIEVAAYDEVGSFGAEGIDPREESSEEVHLKILPYVAHGAAGYIDAYDRDVAEVGTEYPSFLVETFVVHTRLDEVGLLLREDAYARISFSLGRVDGCVVTERLHGGSVYLFGLGLALLDTEDVGIGLG